MKKLKDKIKSITSNNILTFISGNLIKRKLLTK